MLSTHDGVTYKEYVYLNGMKVAVVEDGNISYIHNNYLGVPKVITDASGAVVWEGDYKPFGEMYDVNGTLSNNIRFPGQYKNEETNYSYNYFRDYDPTIGRYLQSDPIGLNGGINTYGYVGGKPVSHTDLLGLVKLNLFAKGGFGKLYVDNHSDDPNKLYVFSHHQENGMFRFEQNGSNDPAYATPLELANMLKDSGIWQRGMEIVLKSCHSANSEADYYNDGRSSAEVISDYLGARVTGATDWLDTHADGTDKVGKVFGKVVPHRAEKEWRTFGG